MSRRRRDALPHTVRLLLDVAFGAHLRGHLRVRPDLLRPVEHPEIELPRARGKRLLMTVVAVQVLVLARLKPAEGRRHDVTTAAEGVVVHHEVPGRRAKSRRGE